MRVDVGQLEVATAPAFTGVVVHTRWQKHVLTFLMVFGPGLIVMEADNDAASALLLVVLLPVCYFVQEMVMRLGIATGKGHAGRTTAGPSSVVNDFFSK